MTARRRNPEEHERPAFSKRLANWAAVILGVFIAFSLTASLVVLPLRDVVRQNKAIAERRSEFDALADANEQLMKEIDHLGSAPGIIAAAREQLGFIFAGEKRVTLLEAPNLPVDLPQEWPYSMVTNIVAVRSGATAP